MAGADLEQSIGGIETLFKDSADTVKQYAAQAYQTVGLSANDYMEQTTSFAASLLSSVSQDTDAAADLANMAMVDMADNSNKMGTSMQDIQNAYQGFAKQNNTMLDNLKLGYGGTQATPVVCYSIAEARTAGVKIPLYGGGGVFNYENAARILMAGSEMVQLGALACAGGTMACKKLISDLNRWMDENGYADMDSLVGDSLKLFQMDADFTKKRQNKLADAYQTADADRTKCIGCGRCEDGCWHQGIEIKERKAYKTDKCIGCGYCFQVCPKQALYVD